MCRYYKGFPGLGLRGDTGLKNCKTRDNSKTQKEVKERDETENGSKYNFVNLALEYFYIQFILLVLELVYKSFYCIEHLVLEKKERLCVLAEESKPRRNRYQIGDSRLQIGDSRYPILTVQI